MPETAADGPEERRPTGPPRVLYVTDEMPVGRSAPSTLDATHGMDVRVVFDRSAVASALDDPFDCVVVEDVAAATLGIGVLEDVASRRPEVPVVVYAVDGGEADPVAWLDAGADDYLAAATDTGDNALLARRVEGNATCRREQDDSRRRYRRLIDTSPDAVVVADADAGRIVEANEAAATLLGRSREALVGARRSDLHPEDDRERYRRLFERHRGGDATARRRFEGDPLHVETAAGDRVPVEIDASTVELGGRTLVQEHFRDASERRHRERTLRAILEASPDVAVVYDEDGTYREVFTGREDLLVDSADALEGRGLREALPGEIADRLHEAIRETIETGARRTVEYDLPIEGESRTFEGRLTPLRTDAYDAECALLLARDVTERERREQDLRTFREAVEQAGHAIMVTDTDGTIEYVNPAFERVTGYAEADALGRTPAILSSGEHDAADYRELWETILAGDVWEGELINERADGERYHIDQTIAPIRDETGSIERFVAVNTDVTERKRYERRLERERDRLESFARTIAHDLRTPLSIAVGHVDLARETGADTLDEAQAALERMETMIDELLTLSREGETVREPTSVRFDRVVEKAWEQAADDAATRALADDCREWTLRADGPRLRRLLENLFGNAVEHAGPDVTVRIGRLPGREGFYVADDGPGIPPGDRSRVFESGFSTAAGGTGFGLAIVEQIAEAHGWEITVADGAEGARFEVATAPPTGEEGP